MARELTELEQKFLDALFGEAEGDPELALELAGGKAKNYVHVLKNLPDNELLDRAKKFMTVNAARAAANLVNIMQDPTQIGVKEKLSAIIQILDRVGLSKTERLEINAAPNSVLILPRKDHETKTED